MPRRYIVELEPSVWLADTEGDPGRTLVWGNAKLFGTEEAAENAIAEARKFRSFPNAAVDTVCAASSEAADCTTEDPESMPFTGHTGDDLWEVLNYINASPMPVEMFDSFLAEYADTKDLRKSLFAAQCEWDC